LDKCLHNHTDNYDQTGAEENQRPARRELVEVEEAADRLEEGKTVSEQPVVQDDYQPYRNGK
jgi:hypothetical protein